MSSPSWGKRSMTCSGGLRPRSSRSGISWPMPRMNCARRSLRNEPSSRSRWPTPMPARRRCDRPVSSCWRWAISRSVSSMRCSPWPAVSAEWTDGTLLISPTAPGRRSWTAARRPSAAASTSTRLSPPLRLRAIRAWSTAWSRTWWTTPSGTTQMAAGSRSRRQRPRGVAIVSVSNTGPLIQPDEVDRLFQPFQRARHRADQAGQRARVRPCHRPRHRRCSRGHAHGEGPA